MVLDLSGVDWNRRGGLHAILLARLRHEPFKSMGTRQWYEVQTTLRRQGIKALSDEHAEALADAVARELPYGLSLETGDHVLRKDEDPFPWDSMDACISAMDGEVDDPGAFCASRYHDAHGVWPGEDKHAWLLGLKVDIERDEFGRFAPGGGGGAVGTDDPVGDGGAADDGAAEAASDHGVDTAAWGERGASIEAAIADLDGDSLLSGDPDARQRAAEKTYSITTSSGLRTEVGEAEESPYTPGALSVTGLIQDADGVECGAFSRTIVPQDDGSVTVNHNSLDLDDHVQGNGFATEFNAQAEDYYVAQGVDKISLVATDVGRYAWSRQGYDYTVDQMRNFSQVERGLGKMTDRLYHGAVDDDIVPYRMHQEVAEAIDDELLGMNPPETAFEVSNVGREVTWQDANGREMWAGKAFLVNDGFVPTMLGMEKPLVPPGETKALSDDDRVSVAAKIADAYRRHHPEGSLVHEPADPQRAMDDPDYRLLHAELEHESASFDQEARAILAEARAEAKVAGAVERKGDDDFWRDGWGRFADLPMPNFSDTVEGEGDVHERFKDADEQTRRRVVKGLRQVDHAVKDMEQRHPNVMENVTVRLADEEAPGGSGSPAWYDRQTGEVVVNFDMLSDERTQDIIASGTHAPAGESFDNEDTVVAAVTYHEIGHALHDAAVVTDGRFNSALGHQIRKARGVRADRRATLDTEVDRLSSGKGWDYAFNEVYSAAGDSGGFRCFDSGGEFLAESFMVDRMKDYIVDSYVEEGMDRQDAIKRQREEYPAPMLMEDMSLALERTAGRLPEGRDHRDAFQGALRRL